MQFYCHIVFHTKYNEKLIEEPVNNELYCYIAGILKNYHSNPIKIGGTRDHVHILCTLPKTMSIADLVEEIKKSSSKWIKTKGDGYTNFYWQDGYGCFSISHSIVSKVISYITNQKQHHREVSYLEEYITILKQNGLAFEEKYL